MVKQDVGAGLAGEGGPTVSLPGRSGAAVIRGSALTAHRRQPPVGSLIQRPTDASLDKQPAITTAADSCHANAKYLSMTTADVGRRVLDREV